MDIIKQFLNAGYYRYLLLVDFLIFIIMVLDVIRSGSYWSEISFDLISLEIHANYWLIFNVIFNMIISLPMIVSTARLFTKATNISAHKSVFSRKNIKIVHIMLSLLLFIIIPLLHSLQNVSGKIGLPPAGTEFNSMTISILSVLPMNFISNIINVIIIVVLPIIITVTMTEDNRSKMQMKLFLMDMKDDYIPVAGLYTYNYYEGVAIPINYNVKKAIRLLRGWPTRNSNRVSDIIRSAEDCKIYIKELYPAFREYERIYFSTGTCRAIDVVLETYNPNVIYYLNWEYVAVKNLIKAHAIMMNRKEHEINADINNYQELDKNIVSEIMDHEKKYNLRDKQKILIVSEVISWNGVYIDVNKLARYIRRNISNIMLVVDGSHSVGNIRNSKLCTMADYYITSGHKWLHSIDPIGIIMTTKRIEGVYDLSSNGLSESTASIVRQRSLEFALRCIQDYGIERVYQRMETIRQRMHDKMMRIDNIFLKDHTTNMFAYKISSSCKEKLEKDKYINLDYTMYDDQCYARIAMPYYLTDHEIVYVANILE